MMKKMTDCLKRKVSNKNEGVMKMKMFSRENVINALSNVAAVGIGAKEIVKVPFNYKKEVVAQAIKDEDNKITQEYIDLEMGDMIEDGLYYGTEEQYNDYISECALNKLEEEIELDARFIPVAESMVDHLVATGVVGADEVATLVDDMADTLKADYLNSDDAPAKPVIAYELATAVVEEDEEIEEEDVVEKERVDDHNDSFLSQVGFIANSVGRDTFNELKNELNLPDVELVIECLEYDDNGDVATVQAQAGYSVDPITDAVSGNNLVLVNIYAMAKSLRIQYKEPLRSEIIVAHMKTVIAHELHHVVQLRDKPEFIREGLIKMQTYFGAYGQLAHEKEANEFAIAYMKGIKSSKFDMFVARYMVLQQDTNRLDLIDKKEFTKLSFMMYGYTFKIDMKRLGKFMIKPFTKKLVQKKAI